MRFVVCVLSTRYNDLARGGPTRLPFLLYAEHVGQLGGASALHSGMDVKW